jgi:uncharacterized protein HemX
MSEFTTPTSASPAPESNKKSKNAIIIAVMAVIILIQAFYLFFKVPQERQELKTELASKKN